MSTKSDLTGARVVLIRCTDEHTRLEPGTLGTVTGVDDAGTVHVAWDTGARLGMVEAAGDAFGVCTPYGMTTCCVCDEPATLASPGAGTEWLPFCASCAAEDPYLEVAVRMHHLDVCTCDGDAVANPGGFDPACPVHGTLEVRADGLTLDAEAADLIGMHREAVCERCGETFLPTGEEMTISAGGVTHFEHYAREDGSACGGFGPIAGTWYVRRDGGAR